MPKHNLLQFRSKIQSICHALDSNTVKAITSKQTQSLKQEANMASKRSPGFRGINQVREDVISKLVEDN